MQGSLELTDKLRAKFGTPPPALRMFVETLLGDRSDITESNLQPNELETLRDIAERQLAKGSKVIGYGDYGENGKYEKNFLEDGTSASVSALTDLRSSLAFTLGMANVRREKDGTIVITDKYDFAASKKKVSDLKEKGTWEILKIATQGFLNNGLLGPANLLGNLVVPQEGGRNVTIRIPPRRD